jgi:two-component system, cell cycle sensor histidine kinase and response regulator CckA
VRINRDARILLVNPAVGRLLGIEPNTILGRTPEELPMSPGRAADFRQRIERFFATGVGEEFELHFKNMPGAPWLLVRYVAELGAEGELLYLLAFLRDVSQIKTVEQEALASARQLGQILETAEEGIVVSDASGILTFNNPKLEQIFGYGPNELLGKHEDIFHLESTEQHWQQRAQERREGLSESYTHHFRRKDGTSVLCWVNAKPLQDERGLFAGTLAMLTDVTDLERSERDLRQSIEWLEFSMESAQIAGMDIDLESGFSRSTVLFREWFGIPDESQDAPERHWIERVHAEDQGRIRTQVQTILDRGTSARADFRLIDSQGELHWLYAVIVTVRGVAGHVVRVVFTVVDITSRRQLEIEREALQNQVARAQREESLGTLAAGFAHDLNNLLTTAFGHIDLARMLVSHPEVEESLDFVGESLTKMTHLSQQLLAYAGKTPPNSKALNLNDALSKVRSIMAVSVGKKAHFTLDLCTERLPIFGEESQLQQVTLNLLLNATDALNGRGGTIRVSTEKRLREHWPASVRSRITHNVHAAAVMSVTDSGCGMDEAALLRLFEPFYSTKGQGRGLGLSVVDGIVRAHEGAIEVESLLDHGTTVTVFLPLDSSATLPLPAGTSIAGTATPQAPCLVLIVDDEPTLRNLIGRTLNNQGFETISASNGDEALVLLAERPDIGLVLLDLTMPERDGLEVYGEILTFYPSLRVMLMSGYNEQSVATRLGPNAPVPAFLNKPFRANELLAMVRKTLDAPERTTVT